MNYEMINYSIAHCLEVFVILAVVAVYKVVHLQNSGEVVILTTALCRNNF